VLTTEYASVVEPLVAFIDELRSARNEQIVVLIPVTIPVRARYRILHNQIDLLLSSALRGRDDVVVARVGLSVAALAGEHDEDTPADATPADATPADAAGPAEQPGEADDDPVRSSDTPEASDPMPGNT
jgi:hypothetical protein